jgi:hypothetical protein
MALNVDLDPGDIVIVPPDSGAQIRVLEKTGRRTKLAIESAKPVKVLRAKDAAAKAPDIQRPTPAALSNARPSS